LAAEGFVHSRQKVGTFVSDKAPHLCQYCVVFNDRLDSDGHTASFAHALAQVATLPDASGRRRTRFYFGVEAHSDNEDYLHLVADVQAHRMAGMIFASSPHHLIGTPVLDEPGIPRVVFRSTPMPGMATMTTDGDEFQRRAAQYLKSKGRSRIAVLSLGLQGVQPEFEQNLQKVFADFGIEVRPQWIQPTTSACAARCAHLLFSGRPEDRPDGLIVADDTLVEGATTGLLAAGVHPPVDVEVVAHCNYPALPRAVTPVRLLGFDVRQIFRMAMDRIDAWRGGEVQSTTQTVPALFEEEVKRT
jgi:DNA-binding LacI/PurR family transcriptional regulator